MNEKAITEALQQMWPERFIALKELMMQRMDYMQRTMDERQAAIKLALDLAAAEVYRRLEILNGEAGRLRDMQATYLPREVYDQHHVQTTKDLRELKEGAANQRGRSQVMSAVVATVVSLAIGLITVIVARAVR